MTCGDVSSGNPLAPAAVDAMRLSHANISLSLANMRLSDAVAHAAAATPTAPLASFSPVDGSTTGAHALMSRHQLHRTFSDTNSFG